MLADWRSDAEGARADAARRTLKIEVTGVDVSLPEVLSANVVRRVLLALSRFGPRVRKVTVCLAELANPLGGVDQRCRMRAWLQEGGDIGAEAIDGGFEAAVARAASQLAQRVECAPDRGTIDRADSRPGSRRRSALRPRRVTRPG